MSIEAVNGKDKVMANWFRMVLKDGARFWLMNLPEESISSWSELLDQFIANFKGAQDCPLTVNDLSM